MMDRDEALAALDELRRFMHEQHSDNRARLEQLDSHLATTAMVVSHLFDETARVADEGK